MSLPFQDHQVKERLLPILWQEFLAKVEREIAPSDNDNLAKAMHGLLAATKISEKSLRIIIDNQGFPLEAPTEVLNQVAHCLGYGNWLGFVKEKQLDDQKPPKRGGPERDGGDFMFWGP